MKETIELVSYLSNMQYEDIPDEAIDTAKLCILDTVGVGLFASKTAWTKITAEMAAATMGIQESVIWGHGIKTTAQYAALVNGVSAHGIEMDDRKPTLGLHPGSSIIPVAIAASEKTNANGKTLLTAIVAGYETAFRIGKAVPKQLPGVNSAAHKGIWGATAAASKVLELDVDQTLNAFGIAGFMASGISEYSQDPLNTMVKRFLGGWPAHNGMTAALLAQRGLTGPWSVLEGKFGYCRVFAEEQDLYIEELAKDLGKSFAIVEREVKPYSAWGGSHICIDAVNQLKTQHQVDSHEIAKIIIRGSSKLIENRQIRRPQSIMAGQISLPFICALALLYDMRDPGIWTEAILQDGQVLAIVDQIECQVDEQIDNKARATYSNGEVTISIILKNGLQREATVEHSRGTSENPLSRDEIKSKFYCLAAQIIPEKQCALLAQTVERLEDIGDINSLGRLLLNSVND